MKLLLSALAGSFVLIAACSASATAQDSRSLYYAADQYRDAVVRFEDKARRVPAMDRFTLRLIDRLEDQTSDLRSASRRVSDLSRLLYEFNEIQSLQPRVEQAVFGTGRPIIRATLGACWNDVLVAYTRFASEVQAIQSPRYQSGFGNRPYCAPPRSSINQPFGPSVGQFPAPRFPAVPFADPRISDPRVPDPRVPDPRLTIPRTQSPFAPQTSFGVPQQERRNDRFGSSRADTGSLLLSGLLSRLARGL